ncbi:ATP-binding cassette domain-containing protein [Noviherbaspirillum cavernae]|uniref:ATP-binding cassette domain-containing protein n=1 Tax=Noviherbaspirillum cavernae TaxID=2320862 RepID=A0A418X3J5_9BURK|nr:ATP-binding cassette domain-containing protein [Noviherbaspirillum cavernae]RJG06961.1 ATP-binding cassette domain-containing protein [Noviherbaspirillum cavernae]
MIEIAFTKTLQSATGRLELDVHAGIESGSFVTLFGPSGAGKTSILRILAGVTTPDHGSIVVDGVTWFDSDKRINLPPQKRAIGFVFQDYALFPNLSVRQNVAYAVTANDAAWVDELLDLMGLTALQHRLPDTLSGGQKQRVALARAIARRPRLLLLDEPLSALDAQLRSQLQDDLLRLHQRFGLTTLLVSHDLGEVFKLSQRVLRLENGRIMQSGSPAEAFLQKQLAGKLQLHAQVLTIRREEVIHIVTLLIGQDIVEVIASDDEVLGLRQGDFISMSAKAFSPLLINSRGS